MPKIGIIVQARMGSRRLEGKVMKEVNHKPLLEYELERLLRVKRLNTLLVATTVHQRDNVIVGCCKRLGIASFRGDEDDVLSRYYLAASEAGLDTVVRVTADCPLIDPVIVDEVIDHFCQEAGKYDYVSNTLTRSYPRGMDTEVFTFKALKKSYMEAPTKADKEHVTPYIYRHPELFKIGEVICPKNLGYYRWTVDTEEDFELIRRILEKLYPLKPRFSMQDCLEVQEQNPEWNKINSHIRQKTYGED